MLRTYKKLALFASVSLAIVLFGISARHAEAFTLYEQTIRSATSTARDMVTSDVKHFYQSLGTGLSGTITGVTFENFVSSISGTPSVAIWSCNGNAQPIGCAGFTNEESKNYTVATSTTIVSVTFDDPVVLNSGRYYYLGFSNGGATATYTFAGSATDTYAGGSCSWMDYPSASIACGGISDMYFTLEGGDGVTIVFPTATSYSGDFNSFWLNYGTGGSGDTTFRVYYATSSGNLNASSTRWEDSNGVSVGGSITLGQIPVVKTNALEPGGTYYARAQLERPTNTNVATSSVVTFEIAGTGQIDSFTRFLPTTAPVSTSTDLTITCDPDSNFFENSFCKLFQYLFVMPDSVWDPYRDLQDDIANKPPFGYVGQVTSLLTTISTSSTSTIDFSYVSGWTGIIDDTEDKIAVVLWLLFIAWAFNRFRHFKF